MDHQHDRAARCPCHEANCRLGIEGLLEYRENSRHHCGIELVVRGVRRHQQHGQVGMGPSQVLEELHATETRHPDVRQDEIDLLVSKNFESLVSIRRFQHLVALELEISCQRDSQGLFVVNQ